MAKVKTDYKWSVELYPDAKNYDCESVLQSLDLAFTHWAYIKHDMDVHEDTGELKKPHIHVVGTRLTEKGENSPCGKDTVCNALGIPANYIEPCKSVNAMVRYLVHADNPEKYQYDRKQIQANFNLDIPPVNPNPDVQIPDDVAPYTVKLGEVFPFCIPFDIYHMVTMFAAEPEAPAATWEFTLPWSGQEFEVSWSLEEWDEVAKLCRSLELVLFCVGLAVATHKMIKW